MKSKEFSFEHDFFPEIQLEQINTENGRFYSVEGTDKRYKSVTTLLGERLPKDDWLKKWKKRVGEIESQKILVQAGIRGTAVHESLEKFLLNENYLDNLMPVNIATVKKFTAVLQNNISIVRGLEFRCYSDELKAAGTIDCVADWKKELAVIDFKTSRRKKQKKNIVSYFLQATAYSCMIKERFSISPSKIIILISNDEDNDLQIFEEDPKRFEGALKKLLIN